MKILLCMVAIAAVANQAVAHDVGEVLQTFSTEAQSFTSPGETMSVPAETRTFTIPGRSVNIPQRTVTIPGRHYRLIETTNSVPQTQVCVPQVCGPGGCGPVDGVGVSVDVNAGGRGLFRREGRRAGRRTGRRFFRRNQ